MIAGTLLLVVGFLAGTARAEIPLPPELAGVGVAARIGTRLDPTLGFTAEDGRAVRLGDIFDGKRPVVLALAWYRCTMVCGLLLAGLADAARRVDPPPGAAWRLLAVSYDPADTVADAREAHRRAMLRVPAGLDWAFWTGPAASLSALATALGVRVARDPRDGGLLHPVVAFVLSPDGVIAGALYGPTFDPVALGDALRAATGGEGPPVAPPGDTRGSLVAPLHPIVCARPQNPPPVYRAWLQAAGLLGGGLTASILVALGLCARRAARGPRSTRAPRGPAPR
jgi:protein SCO1/2